MDVTNFEDSLQKFRDSFKKSVQYAGDRFKDAIDGIDNTIKSLEAIKKNLQVSQGHLITANNKVDDLKIRQLIKNNPTMTAAFEEARAQKAQQELEEGPDEQ